MNCCNVGSAPRAALNSGRKTLPCLLGARLSEGFVSCWVSLHRISSAQLMIATLKQSFWDHVRLICNKWRESPLHVMHILMYIFNVRMCVSSGGSTERSRSCSLSTPRLSHVARPWWKRGGTVAAYYITMHQTYFSWIQFILSYTHGFSKHWQLSQCQ